MSENDKPKVDLAALAEEFHVPTAPEDPAERIAREQAEAQGDKKKKRTNRMKAFTMGNVGNSGGG